MRSGTHQKFGEERTVASLDEALAPWQRALHLRAATLVDERPAHLVSADRRVVLSVLPQRIGAASCGGQPCSVNEHKERLLTSRCQ